MTVSGETSPGGNMRVHVRTARNGEGWYKLKSNMERNSERIIAFSNVLFARFLFLGRHRFEITPLSNDRTKFINAEVFSGLLVPFVRKKSPLTVTRRFKEHVNASLKKSVEAL